MPIDPFAIKSKPKWHPFRLMRTAEMRLQDYISRRNYDRYEIPQKRPGGSIDPPEIDTQNTSVTAAQMGYLLTGLRETESLAGTVVAEVGCFRGVTTRTIAGNTRRRVIAVDPYMGYGGSESDYAIFKSNVSGLENVTHERKTSGRAVAEWNHGPVGFVFIDAVHDYANTSFDLEIWKSRMARGAIMALHDTDNPQFAGTRRAAFEGLRGMDLYGHTDNLVLLRKPAGSP